MLFIQVLSTVGSHFAPVFYAEFYIPVTARASRLMGIVIGITMSQGPTALRNDEAFPPNLSVCLSCIVRCTSSQRQTDSPITFLLLAPPGPPGPPLHTHYLPLCNNRPAPHRCTIPDTARSTAASSSNRQVTAAAPRASIPPVNTICPCLTVAAFQ